MYIYIDESGSFAESIRPHKVAALAAIVVPQSQRRSLLRRLKPLLEGTDGRELKGSELDEAAMAAILSVASTYDVVVQICGIDMGLQGMADLVTFQQSEAERMTSGLTAAHSQELHSWAHGLRSALLCLPPQLLVQCVATVHLLTDVLEMATLYYSQRIPRELAVFRWRVDAKDIQLTPYEKLWSEIILPWAQSRPVSTLTDANYTHFKRFEVNKDDAPASLREHMEATGCPEGTDLRMVFKEDLQFVDSQGDIGIRLADVVASAFTRAANGALDQSGWIGLGKLLVHGPRDPISMIQIGGPVEGTWSTVIAPYGSVIRTLTESARELLVETPEL